MSLRIVFPADINSLAPNDIDGVPEVGVGSVVKPGEAVVYAFAIRQVAERHNRAGTRSIVTPRTYLHPVVDGLCYLLGNEMP
ncbi:hypothetical protein JZ785_02615 [Alicyclobacillus curvatus]|nr:hypothetical protein JZ785_02615 [Alicyclobacillus curvatus]